MTRGLAIALGLFTLTSPIRSEEVAPLKVRLESGEIARDAPVVRLALPEAWRGQRVGVFERAGGNRLPSQQDPRDPGRLLWRSPRRLDAGEVLQCEIRVVDTDAEAAPAARCEVTDRAVRLVVNDRPVVQYNTAVVEPPDGVDPVFRRSGHLHPLWTPAGKIVTDEFPRDHAHQHGVFHAWVNTTFAGRKVDFWNQAGRTGTVAHSRLEMTADGDVAASLTAVLDHQVLEEGREPVAALRETLTLTAWVIPESGWRIVDVESIQACAGSEPLTLNEYHYGGFAIRGAADWFQQPESDFLTSEGRHRDDGNHTRPRWVDLHGLVAGEPCGLALIDHPDNVRSPQPVRLHPDKPYFVASPPVLGELSITPDRPYRARYRLVLHDGPPDPALLNRLADDFARPMTATVE